MKLFIDDERYPPGDGLGWEIVRDFDQAIAYMETGCPAFISFDHDLGDGPTGYDIARWMIDRDLDHPGFIPDDFQYDIHSQNPIGAANIKAILDRYLEFR